MRIAAIGAACMVIAQGGGRAATMLWTTEADGNWSAAASWTDLATPTTHAVPTSTDTARLSAATLYEVTVNSNVGTVSQIQFANGANADKGSLHIKEGGSLSVATDIVSSNKTSGVSLIYQEGGSLSALNISWGRTTNTTSEYYMSGGTLTVTNILGLGGYSGSTTGYGYFHQSGGAVSVGVLGLDAANASGTSRGVYEISGGTLSAATAINNGTTATNDDGTLRVVGSTATINVTGASGTYKQGANSKLELQLDNGGITKVNLNGASSVATLNGTLSAGFKGGAALTTATSFRVMEAESFSGDFATEPNASLWTTAIQANVDGTRDAYVLSLNSAAKVGALSLTGTSEITFSATVMGYADVTGLSLGQSTWIYLDASAGTGKTIADLLAYFTANGLSASAISIDGYDISLQFTAQSGTSYFGWDLSSFNADAQISGLALVPEPSSALLLATGLGAMGMAVARRRQA